MAGLRPARAAGSRGQTGHTSFTSAGVSWLLDGHARKITLDWTRIDHQGPGREGLGVEKRDLVTLQVAAGF